MSTSTFRAFLTPAKLFLLALLLPIVLTITLGVIGGWLYVFFDYNEIHYFIGAIWSYIILMAFICFLSPLFWITILVAVVYLWFRRGLARAALWFILFSIYASFILLLEGRFLEASLPYFQYLKLTRSGEDARCIRLAADIGSGKLAVCGRYLFDNRTWSLARLEDARIVYDSSDQIAFPITRRSPAWHTAAGKLELINPLIDSTGQTCRQDNFISITSLGRHFYFVILPYSVTLKDC